MSHIKNNSTSAAIYAIKYQEPQPRPHQKDAVDERDIIGTSRTVVTRLGFGSKELEMTLYLFPAEWAKLNTMRGTVVEYEGAVYDLTVSSVAQYDTRLYEVDIRLKGVTL